MAILFAPVCIILHTANEKKKFLPDEIQAWTILITITCYNTVAAQLTYSYSLFQIEWHLCNSEFAILVKWS